MATDIKAVIGTAVQAALGSIPVEAIEIEQRLDSVDEDALYITVTLPPSTPLLGGKTYLGAMTAVSDALLGIGDRRFPYLRLHHAGEETAMESERSRAPVP